MVPGAVPAALVPVAAAQSAITAIIAMLVPPQKDCVTAMFAALVAPRQLCHCLIIYYKPEQRVEGRSDDLTETVQLMRQADRNFWPKMLK